MVETFSTCFDKKRCKVTQKNPIDANNLRFF